MNTLLLLRLQTWLAGLWAGLLVAVGGLAAPSLFAALERQQAGLAAGHLFALEAKVSLVLAMILFVLERRRVRVETERTGSGSAMSAALLLVLAALFLTVFGHFALHPMIQAAKAGQATALSFAALHGISALMFALKGLAVMALAWRQTALTLKPASC